MSIANVKETLNLQIQVKSNTYMCSLYLSLGKFCAKICQSYLPQTAGPCQQHDDYNTFVHNISLILEIALAIVF